MSIINFSYFRDPNNFAFRIEQTSNCSLCNKKGLWFDASVFSGENDTEHLLYQAGRIDHGHTLTGNTAFSNE
jgi:hypothetical protein